MPKLISELRRIEAAGTKPKLIDLSGRLRVEAEDGSLDVREGQAVLVRGGEWVRYSTPEVAEYVAVCLPAFSPETVHRDEA